MEKRKLKILNKMYKDGIILKHEYEKGLVSNEKIEMYIRGIKFISKGTIISELEARQKIFDETGDKKIKKEIDKIKSIKIDQPIVLKNQIDFSGVKSQFEAIKLHLETFKTITSVEAITEYGCTRLSDKIYKLRNEGMAIKTHLITKTNRWNNLVTFAKYELQGTKEQDTGS